MSLHSMTGHGRGTARSRELSVEVELQAVNRKQLDIQVNLPRGLSVLEADLRALLQRSVSRGRVQVSLSVTALKENVLQRVVIDEALAASYLKGLRGMGKQLEVEGDLRLPDLLRLPEVVRLESAAPQPEKLWKTVKPALQEAVTGLLAMREKEGGTLARDLERRLKEMEKLRVRLQRKVPASTRRARAAMRQRLESAGLPLDLDDERLLKELALFADRSDVSEELQRIDSHLQQARDLLEQAGPVGRSLDFLAQELGREINTTGAKVNDADMARVVIAFKSELEKLREQVQNVE